MIKGANPVRRYNPCSCTQHRSTKRKKQILMDIKGKINSKTLDILGNFNTLLTSMDRYPREKINKEITAL